MQTILKKIYKEADIDFLIRESVALTDLELGQTFLEYRKAAKYTYNLLKKEGIDAEFITFPADGVTTYQDFRTPIAWKATMGRVTVLESPIPFDDPVIADFSRHPFHLAKGSTALPKGGVEARLISEEQAFSEENIEGAIVLFNAGTRVRSNVLSPILDRGAIGFINCAVGRGAEKEAPDSITWCNAATDDHAHWHVQSEDRDFVGYSISPNMADKLREAISKGEVRVLLESDAERYAGEIDAVCGYVRGKSEKEIWIIAHLFEPFITDNSLSVIMAIEIAKKIKAYKTPEFSIRLVFSAETYGLAAVWDYYKDRLKGKVLGAIDIDTPPAYVYDKNFDTRFNSYASPFFGNYLFLLATKAYENVFPEYEKCAKVRIEYGDDLIIGDPTIGIPTIYFEEEKCHFWHSTHWSMDYIDKDRVRRSYSMAALWCFIMAYLDEKSLKEFLPECVKSAEQKLENEAKKGNTKERMEYFLKGERAQILDFYRAVDIPEIKEAAEKLSVSPDSDEKITSPALCKAEKIIVSRKTEGFMHDLVRIPYEKRRTLPDGALYGPFATVIAGLDGKKNLAEIIVGAFWEAESAVSEEKIYEYIDAIEYLAEAGYLEIKSI